MVKFSDEPNLPTFLRIIVKLLIGWLISLVRILFVLCKRWHEARRGRRRHKWPVPCRTYPSDLWVRPDVYIYSQRWLLSQGLAVTWNNPDIELRYGGVQVDSYHLEPDKEYDIIAKVHNRSISSPAIGVRVIFSVRGFGIGGGVASIGETKVDVSVLGGASNPALAQVKWQTPSTPGHYCIVVKLVPVDDLNWADNEGQENTSVVEVSPGDPSFKVSVFTDAEEEKRVVLRVDSYKLPEKPLPPGLRDAKRFAGPTKSAIRGIGLLFGFGDPDFLAKQLTAAREWSATRRQEVIQANALENFPVPPEWNVSLEKEVTVPPKKGIDVPFTFKVPQGAREGQEQVFNITGLDKKGNVLGGVTFIAKVKRP